MNRVGYRFYKVPSFAKSEPKYQYFKRLYDSVRHIEGTVVECGIGYGNSLCVLAGLAKGEREVWGFDSFEGFPEPAPQDASPRNPQKGQWAVSTVQSITAKLMSFGLSAILIKGFFGDSLKEYTGDPIALLHLDGDLYQSYKDCLEQLYDKVADGGVILFDEYNTVNFPGGTQAINEFFGERIKYIRYDSSANRYFIYKQFEVVK